MTLAKVIFACYACFILLVLTAAFVIGLAGR
jgi:hypothetical protein